MTKRIQAMAEASETEANAQDEVIEDDRRHHRDGDVAETAQDTGAVEHCRLIESNGNSLQPSQEDQRYLTRAELGQENKGQFGPRWVTKPVDVRQAQSDQDLIEDALGRVHEDEEDEGEG